MNDPAALADAAYNYLVEKGHDPEVRAVVERVRRWSIDGWQAVGREAGLEHAVTLSGAYAALNVLEERAGMEASSPSDD